jgi:spore photoproduct lyase
MKSAEQLSLFPHEQEGFSLPLGEEPVRPGGFQIDTIILSKGSLDTPEREAFVRRICGVYPELAVEEQLDVPHNRIELGEDDPLRRQARGKRTLVLGVLNPASAVRCTQVNDAEQPFRWHFSVYGHCFYGCSYCYLAGTDGVWHSPTVRVYVNLPEIVEEIERQANKLGTVTTFYLGKLQDGLSLDPLTAYSSVLLPFFAQHPWARLLIQTKSASVVRLINLEHRGHTTLSWSLNPPEIVNRFESNVPSVEARICAMQQCANAGYPVRGLIQPFIPHGDWENVYESFVCELMERVPLRELSIAGMCIGHRAVSLFERRTGHENAISRNLSSMPSRGGNGTHYGNAIVERLFLRISKTVHNRWPGWRVSTGTQYPSELGSLKIRPPAMLHEGTENAHVSK